METWTRSQLRAGKYRDAQARLASDAPPHVSCQSTAVHFICCTKQVPRLRCQTVWDNHSS